MYQLVKRPTGRNRMSGNVTLTDKEWYALCQGLYSTILVIRTKETTKVYQVEDWMIEAAHEITTDDGPVMLVPVSKGSSVYRRWMVA